MIKSCISWFATKIKGRPVNFDPAITSGYLIQVSLSHAIGIIRGIIKMHRIASIGSHVSLRGKKSIKLGSGIVIGDFCVFDGVGRDGLKIGDRSSIGRFAVIKVSGSLGSIGKGISIGKDVGIGDYCHIGGAGGVCIGDSTIIGSYFSAHPENHIFEDKDIPIRLQGVSHKGIYIGGNCWIGAKVTILDGAKIGSGCVIAAGAVVKGKFPDGSIIGGVPAKILKKTSN